MDYNKRNEELFEELKQYEPNSQKWKDIRDEIFSLNINLAYYVAQKYPSYNSNYEKDDRIQIACFGLVKAIDTYSPSGGMKFKNYACLIMKNEILMYLRKENKKSKPKTVSFETIVAKKGEDTNTYGDVLESDFYTLDNIDVQIDANLLVKKVLPMLSKKEQEVIWRYYLNDDGATHKEIAEEMHCDRSYITRIKINAEKKIKEIIEKMTSTNTKNEGDESE